MSAPPLAPISPPITTCADAPLPAHDPVDPETRRIRRQLRERGADDDTILLCLGMSRLDTIIRNHRGRRRHVFFASFPKSGTTLLHRLLLASTGFGDYLIDRFSEDQQQNVIRQWMPMFLAQDTVTQIHMFATAPNTRMLRELGVRPVVLVRNLMDTLVSLHDHLMTEDHVVPMAHVPIEFRAWPLDDRLWFIVRMVAPWYLNFFASWQRAGSELDVHWVTYESLIGSPVKTVAGVLEHSSVKVDPEHIRKVVASVDRAQTRFNVGMPGRGPRMLSAEQTETLQALAASFKEARNFSMIGL